MPLQEQVSQTIAETAQVQEQLAQQSDTLAETISVIGRSVEVVQSIEKLGVIGILFLLVLLISGACYYLLKRIVEQEVAHKGAQEVALRLASAIETLEAKVEERESNVRALVDTAVKSITADVNNEINQARAAVMETIRGAAQLSSQHEASVLKALAELKGQTDTRTYSVEKGLQYLSNNLKKTYLEILAIVRDIGDIRTKETLDTLNRAIDLKRELESNNLTIKKIKATRKAAGKSEVDSVSTEDSSSG